MDNNDRLRRADNAARTLNDPMWDENWTTLIERITAATMAAKTDEGTLRGKLMHGLALDLRAIWEAQIKDGAVLRHNIKLDKQNWWQRAA